MKVIDVQSINNSKYDVNWGNGTSRRMLVDQDNMGYTMGFDNDKYFNNKYGGLE